MALFTARPYVLPLPASLYLSSSPKEHHSFNPHERNSNVKGFVGWNWKTQNHSHIYKGCALEGFPCDVKAESSAAEFQNTISLREICSGLIPEHILRRMEEIGYITPTDVQLQALPILFSGDDCILHAQTGSGKTLTYLLPVFSSVNTKRSAVQALIVVPTRELGMQVTKVARTLAAQPAHSEPQQRPCSVMALLDGGTLKRHRSWLKAEPPTIVVATVSVLCRMLDRHMLTLEALKVLVVDEVDFMFSSSEQVSALRKLLTIYSSCNARQTILASASIPQHRHFIHECIQHKWTKSNVVHVHVNSVTPMPLRIHHRYMVRLQSLSNHCLFVTRAITFDYPVFFYLCCYYMVLYSHLKRSRKTLTIGLNTNRKTYLSKCVDMLQVSRRDQRREALMSLLEFDAPESAMIFVNQQSEKSRKAGEAPPEILLVDLLKNKFKDVSDVLLLKEDMNINSRAASLLEAKTKARYLLVATDLAARGVDLPEVTHIYNFDLPKTAVDYLHRAGRTSRKPFSEESFTVTSIIALEEHFVLQRYENELKFNSEEIVL